MTTLTDNAYRAAARKIYEEGDALGAIDIPVGAEVRGDYDAGDAGCWVEAWVWVPDTAAMASDPLAAYDAPAFVRAALARRARACEAVA